MRTDHRGWLTAPFGTQRCPVEGIDFLRESGALRRLVQAAWCRLQETGETFCFQASLKL